MLLHPAPGGPAAGECSLGLRLPSDRPVSFGEDADGRIYVVSHAGGVYRLTGADFAGCTPFVPQIVPMPPPEQLPDTSEAPSPEPAIRLGIRVVRPVPDGPVSILVRARPCGDEAGRTVLLRRGGEPNGSMPSDDACRARFSRRVRGRSTFRAILAAAPGGAAVRSRSVTVAP